MKKIILFMLLITCSIYLNAQVKLSRERQLNTQNEVSWIRELYKESPNLLVLKKLYTEYYKNNIFDKNRHTQYYKELMKTYSIYMLKNGSIDFDAYNKDNNSIYSNQTVMNSSNWVDIGIEATFKYNSIPLTINSNIQCIAQSKSNPNILYVGTESGGIWKTTDKSNTWTAVGSNQNFHNIKSLVIHPLNENIVLSGTNNGVYKSSDGGANWDKVLERTHVESLTYSLDGEIIFATARSNDGFYKSINGGDNWILIDGTTQYFDVKPHPTKLNTIYAIKLDKENKRALPVRSDNKGENWTKLNNGWYMPPAYNGIGTDQRTMSGARIAVTKAAPNSVFIIPAGDAKAGDNGQIGVYKSINEGNLWTNLLPQEGGPYHNAVGRIKGSSEVIPSDPNGMTYMMGYSSGYHQGYYNLDIAVSQIDSTKIFIGGIHPYKVSLDGTVQKLSTGHADQQEYLFDQEDPNLLWIVNDGGLIKYNVTDDTYVSIEGIRARDMWGFSQAWNFDLWGGGAYHNGNVIYREDYPLHKGNFVGGAESFTGSVHPINNSIYFDDIGSKFINSSSNYTTPATSSHTNVKKPNRNGKIQSNRFIEWHPLYHNTIYEGVEQSLWKSTDIGRTYTEVKKFSSNVNQIVISRVNPKVLWVVTQNKLYKSLDEGVNWIPINSLTVTSNDLSGLELSGSDENKLWYYNSYTIKQSNDGGATWIDIPRPQEVTYIQSMVHQLGTEETLYLLSKKKVYIKEQGTDWEEYSNNLPLNTNYLTIEPFYNKGEIRVAGGRGVWSSPLKNFDTVLAQPITSQQVNDLDTEIQFDSYSVINSTNAIWEWTFPGASYVSSTSIRNPIVKYDTPGRHNVTLKVTDANGNTSTKTVENMVWIGENTCNNYILADSFVRNGSSSNSNFGQDDVLLVKNDPVDGLYREAYYLIDLSKIEPLNYSEITLKLPIENISSSLTLNLYQTDASWTEYSITYNNKPTYSNTVYDSKNITTNDIEVKFNIKEAIINAKQNNKSELSLLIKAVEEGNKYVSFYTKESAYKNPQIEFSGEKEYITQDAYVRGESYADTNYGNAEELFIKNDESSFYREFYMKIDITNLNVSNYPVLKLHLPIKEIGDNLEVGYFVVENNWTEETITYNNKPNLVSNQEYDSQLISKTADAIIFNIKNVVAEAKAEGKNEISLLIKSKNYGGSNYAILFSRENFCNNPELIFSESKNYIIDDAFVKNGSSANTNFGSDNYLMIKKDPVAGFYRESYLKIDIKDINTSSHQVLLHLPILTVSSNLESSIYRVNNNWEEKTITFNTRPSIISTTMEDVKTIANGDKELIYDISSLIQAAQSDGDDKLSLLLKSEREGGSVYASFASKENSGEKPKLTFHPLQSLASLTIDEKDTVKQIKVFPTVFSESLYLQNYNYKGDATIAVFNIIGHLTAKKEHKFTANSTLDLSSMMKNLNTGHYLIKVVVNDETNNFRVFKK